MEQIIDIFKNIKRNTYTTVVGIIILLQAAYVFHENKIGVTDYLIAIAASLSLIFYAPKGQAGNQKQN
ncbi:MAG: hypothetical protein KatS3mg087_1895 [Patescibacteria group bacterium]|nr:MAG: hypothetical protein KatS3mg087_1895 [Patescibacteria group bacterium]